MNNNTNIETKPEQMQKVDYPLPSKTMYTVYTKTNCKYCEKVKDYLMDSGFEYNVILCDDYLVKKIDFLEFIENIAEVPYNTFPMVFHKGNFVGGYNETLKYCAFQ